MSNDLTFYDSSGLYRLPTIRDVSQLIKTKLASTPKVEVKFKMDNFDIEDGTIEEGFTRVQFMAALESVSGKIAEKAETAKTGGMLGQDTTRKLLDSIRNANP